MTNVRAPLGALVVLMLVVFAAGCGSDSDQGQARQEEATKNTEAKGQQARQTVKKKVEAKKQELKKVEALQKQVNDLHKEVNELQKKINAHEQCCVLHLIAFSVVSEWCQKYANFASQFVCQASRNLHASHPSANDAMDKVARLQPYRR